MPSITIVIPGLILLISLFAIFILLFSPFGLGPVTASLLPEKFFTEPTTSDELTLLVEGEEAFDEILRQLGKAKKSIFVQTFIFRGDNIGRLVANELVKAGRRGVHVTVRKDVAGFFFELRDTISGRRSPVFPGGILSGEPGIDVVVDIFRATDHSKYFIIDNRLVLFGGMNIGDEYHLNWLDYMVKLDSDWSTAFGAVMSEGKDWPTTAPFILATNSREKCEIKRGILEVIESSKKSALLLHAYFSDDDIILALTEAKKRGVDVDVIMPRDPGTHFFANRVTINRLLLAKVNVFLYPKMSHAKVALIDGKISVTGSANLTHRSMRRSIEVSLFHHGRKDDPFTVSLHESLHKVKHESQQVSDPFALGWHEKVAAIVGKYTW